MLFHTALATPVVFPRQPSISNTTTSNRIETCTFIPHWVPNIVRYPDCLGALSIFHGAESTLPTTERYEFLARGSPRTTTLTPLQTPRKYRQKTCTIAVAMLSTFPMSFLPPGAERRVYEGSDVATLDELMGAATEVALDCVKEPRVRSRPTVGWTPRGTLSRRGIAVAVWESGSFIDRLIPGGVEIGRNGSWVGDLEVE
ncbi:MAG: hypothetical protein Q9195_003532 [Heterodermia aff. obscurata]